MRKKLFDAVDNGQIVKVSGENHYHLFKKDGNNYQVQRHIEKPHKSCRVMTYDDNKIKSLSKEDRFYNAFNRINLSTKLKIRWNYKQK